MRFQFAGLPVQRVLPVLPTGMMITSPAAWVGSVAVIVVPVPPGFVGVESRMVGLGTFSYCVYGRPTIEKFRPVGQIELSTKAVTLIT